MLQYVGIEGGRRSCSRGLWQDFSSQKPANVFMLVTSTNCRQRMLRWRSIGCRHHREPVQPFFSPCPRMLRPAFRTAGRDRCLPMYSPPQPVHDQRSPTATNVHPAATLGFCIRYGGSRSPYQGPIASRRFSGVGFTLPMRDGQGAAGLIEHEGNRKCGSTIQDARNAFWRMNTT